MYTKEKVKEMRNYMENNKATYGQVGKKFGTPSSSVGYALLESPGAKELGPFKYLKNNTDGVNKIYKTDKRPYAKKPAFVDLVQLPETPSVAVVFCKPQDLKTILGKFL